MSIRLVQPERNIRDVFTRVPESSCQSSSIEMYQEERKVEFSLCRDRAEETNGKTSQQALSLTG